MMMYPWLGKNVGKLFVWFQILCSCSCEMYNRCHVPFGHVLLPLLFDVWPGLECFTSLQNESRVKYMCRNNKFLQSMAQTNGNLQKKKFHAGLWFTGKLEVLLLLCCSKLTSHVHLSIF